MKVQVSMPFDTINSNGSKISAVFGEIVKTKHGNPIIISLTEPILAGDKRFAFDVGIVETSENEAYMLKEQKGIWSKVLAFSDQFSEKHIQQLEEGKLSYDKVLLECDPKIVDVNGNPIGSSTKQATNETFNSIKLDYNSKVIIYDYLPDGFYWFKPFSDKDWEIGRYVSADFKVKYTNGGYQHLANVFDYDRTPIKRQPISTKN